MSGNTTNAAGAGNGGGAVYFLNTPFGDTNLLSFDTIAGNSAPSASGGGLFAFGTGNSIKASIVAANTAPSGKDCAGAANGANAFTFTSAGYNLEDSPDTCSFTQPTDKVVAASSLGLGPLANNGGATMTRSLLSGSSGDQRGPRRFVHGPGPRRRRSRSRPTSAASRGHSPPAGTATSARSSSVTSDVSVTGSIAPATVNVGQHATIKLTVKNAGPVPATATAVIASRPPRASR